MKAFVFPRYGSPDVLECIEVDKPTPNEDQVLVKIQTASANPLDWHRMRADPFIVRLDEGFRKPKDPQIGADIAGRVEAVGSNVTQFKVGDEVFGDIGAGGFAEYALTKANNLALKPANVSFEDVAAVPVAALTALQGLRDKGQIKAGQKVLINGASGGVGTYAVQIAKSYGAEVTGVCSTRNLELVRSIGADHVIDYTKEDFTKKGQRYDLILDAVGNCSFAAYRRTLTPNGICVVAGFTTLPRMLFHVVLLGSIASKFGNKKIGTMLADIEQKDLELLAELLESGKVTSVIDRRYPFSEMPEAIRYLETGRARGKVIINIGSSE